ncbi:MAG TPA: AAA family ATPase, partial [Fervidobacterium sp.]|nr:AAA family ATPase [Fervidobacterium sp.]
MKITQFSITRYGPLNLQSTYKLGKFNVFYGPNESGKTLTVDALIKLLFQANNKQLIKDFEKIDRVNEKPEGFVVVEENGKESKLPEKGKITELTKLSTSDFRNIFIIRSSDLSISKE